MRWIPNFLTCLNLLCGCIGITMAFQGNLIAASYLVGLACIFDFLDGMMARLLKAQSEIGKQLDSLADMVTFGVLPGMIMFHLIIFTSLPDLVDDAISFGANLFGLSVKEDPEFDVGMLIPFVAFLIPIFSALRLAKFNIDTRQSDSFIGLPTPANALFIASIPLIYGIEASDPISGSFIKKIMESVFGDLFSAPSHAVGYFRDLLVSRAALVILTIVLSLLLVSPVKLIALKFKSFAWSGNEVRYLFIASAITLIFIFGFFGIPLTIIAYIVFSLVNNFIEK